MASAEHHEMSSSLTKNELRKRLELNQQYQKVLNDQLKELSVLITENAEKQRVALEISAKKSGQRKDLSLDRVLEAPYFMDARGTQPPSNRDALAKKALKAVPMVHRTNRWTTKEKSSLQAGVLAQQRKRHSAHYMVEYQNDLAAGRKVRTEDISDDDILRGAVDIDWDEIARSHVKTRSALDCKIEWYYDGDPNINRGPWSKQEDRDLFQAAVKHKGRNWVAISQELSLNRTPLQCFMRYQRALNPKVLQSKWTKEHDDKLRQLVAEHGEHNWMLVANAFEDRTDQQCLHRYHKTLDPTVSKARWTEMEDERLKLVTAAYEFKGWNMIRRHMKYRTDVQCRERYLNVLDPRVNRSTVSWTNLEDNRILELAPILKYSWAQLAAKLGGRTDSQVLRRWKTIASAKQQADYKTYRESLKYKEVTHLLPVTPENVLAAVGSSKRRRRSTVKRDLRVGVAGAVDDVDPEPEEIVKLVGDYTKKLPPARDVQADDDDNTDDDDESTEDDESTSSGEDDVEMKVPTAAAVAIPGVAPQQPPPPQQQKRKRAAAGAVTVVPEPSDQPPAAKKARGGTIVAPVATPGPLVPTAKRVGPATVVVSTDAIPIAKGVPVVKAPVAKMP